MSKVYKYACKAPSGPVSKWAQCSVDTALAAAVAGVVGGCSDGGGLILVVNTLAVKHHSIILLYLMAKRYRKQTEIDVIVDLALWISSQKLSIALLG